MTFTIKPSGVITLLSDFGWDDPYVGVMKGVILSINQRANMVDLAHTVEAGSVLNGALIILEAFPFFPEGTVHVAVIDPGVGGERRPLVVGVAGHLFVGPDNGLFWPVLETHGKGHVIHLKESRYFLDSISHTFHGRDVFAPVAAHLSMGVDPNQMGVTIKDPVPLPLPKPGERGEGLLKGQIIRVDRFGNLITNIHLNDLKPFLGAETPIVQVGPIVVHGLHKTYSDVSKGERLALLGSFGYLEISVNMGRACDQMGLEGKKLLGEEVKVFKSKETS
jgi:S-adenosylmethionine hydrolase